MAIEVRNDPEHSQYVIEVDGEKVGIAAYQVRDESIVFTHTEVDTNRREKGLAGQLVETALNDVRDNTSLRVVAQCPYVSHWLTKHPDYQWLLTR